MSQPWFPKSCDCPPAPCPPPWPPCPPPTFSPPTPPWYPGANAGVSFGTSFPPNPCRGHFLWDGSLLWMWDGVAWQKIGPVPAVAFGIPEAPIDGNLYGRENASWVKVAASGTTTLSPTTHVFAITQPVNLSITQTVWNAIPYTATPNIDTEGAWNASNYRYTPNKSGTYFFMARGYGGAAGEGIALVKNDGGTFAGVQTDTVIGALASSGGLGWMYVSGMTVMNGSTDYIRVWGYSTQASPNNWLHVGANDAFGAWLLP